MVDYIGVALGGSLALAGQIITEIMKTGCFISGGRGSGKSNLCFWIAEKLMMNNILVKVIDPTLTSRKNSSIPYFQT